MKKKVENWAVRANKVGFINIHCITTCGVSSYQVDHGGFAWCWMDSKEYKQLTSVLNSNVKINIK